MASERYTRIQDAEKAAVRVHHVVAEECLGWASTPGQVGASPQRRPQRPSVRDCHVQPGPGHDAGIGTEKGRVSKVPLFGFDGF